MKKQMFEIFANKDGVVCKKPASENSVKFDFSLPLIGKYVVLTTKKGKCIVFKESDLRAMGASSKGVRGIRLAEGDKVISLEIADKCSKEILQQRGAVGRDINRAK